MGTWPYKNCLYSSEVERPKELPVSSLRWLVCKRIPSKSLTLFFLWKVHLAAIEAEAVAFPWSFLCLIFAIQPPGAPFTLLLNVMHFLNCLEKLVSLRSPALNLYFTLLWRIPPVYCKGYYLESLPWKFTKGQSQGKKNHLKPETVALQDVYMHIQTPLMWLSISKSYITSWLHHLREMKG